MKLRCYKCDSVLKKSDNFVFVGGLAVHYNDCPVKLTEKQTEYLCRMYAGDYGIPRDNGMWRWAKGDKASMNGAVVHSLWDKRLIAQTDTYQKETLCECEEPDRQQISNLGPDQCRKCGRLTRRSVDNVRMLMTETGKKVARGL